MPLNILATAYVEGPQAIPYYNQLKVWVPGLALLYGLKSYFAGPRNTWDRDMHGRVVMVTGGTSGLGAVLVKELAQRGAQIVLLVKDIQDGWLTEYIEDLREVTNNMMIYAEECDLRSLYSVRKFATKWIDNMPVRRLDMVVCCAGIAQPPTVPRTTTNVDNLEPQFEVNYLSHFLLLDVLAPALRAQPPDRDVRVILTSCISSVMAEFNLSDLGYNLRKYPKNKPYLVSGEAKLYLALSAYAWQREFNAYERKDKAPSNVHLAVVDPGMMRSPSFKRFFSLGGRLWTILLYLVLWPVWWLFMKSSVDGAQSMLFASLSPDISNTHQVSYISQCKIRDAPPRSEFKDEERQNMLMKTTRELLKTTEERLAKERKLREGKSNKKANKTKSE